MQDELLLLARARALEPEALAEIHDTYYTPIFRYVALRIGDRQAAEDLASDVFIRLLSALRDHTAPQRTLRGWLYAVASRVVADYHRRGYRVQHVELSETLSTQAMPLDELIERRMTWDNLQRAMTDLTDDQQDVLALRFGQGLPIRDVAEIMGRSEGAVKQLQARAVAALTRKLAGDVGN